MQKTQMLEKKWQEAWKNAKLFDTERNKAEKFFITIPYPYISGSLHVGHARVVIEADVYARYLRMSGKNVLFPIAFHISGTPVLGISLALKNNDKEKIELYRGYVRKYVSNEKKVVEIVQSFEEPQKIVDFFIPLMKQEFSTLGLSVDWRRSFTSGDIEHQKLVEWQFLKYKKKGYLVQGKYPILYSKELGNAVGEDDIIDGDLDPVEKQEFTLVKFPFEDKVFVAATLRPETLFGQTNLWVNPQITYIIAIVGKEKWIASKECFEKLELQEQHPKFVGTITGEELLGKHCTAPFVDKNIIILPSEHCDPDRGTGIVTSVPSDAPYDWIALKELQDSKDLCKKYFLPYEEIKKIRPIAIISSKGFGDFPAEDYCKKVSITSLQQKNELIEATQEIYKTGFHTGIMTQNCGKFSGMSTIKAREQMKQELLLQKKGSVMFETSRPAKARDGSKVIVAVLDNQWFLDFTAKKWKEEAHDALKKIEIVPEKYRKQFEETFLWLDKRPCARRRGLGTKLPFDQQWTIESLSDSTIYMALYPLCHKLRAAKLKEEQLTEEFFDYVLLGEGRGQDVAQKGKIAENVLEDLRQEFDYWYPFDHRHTFTVHLSNHLSFMLFAHAALFPKKKWPKKITFNGMVISEGVKMSKSKGNVVTLLDVNDLYGADTFRAFMCSSTSVESTFNWETKEVEKMKNHVDALFLLLNEFITDRRKGLMPVRSAAFVSRVEKITQKATEYLIKMDLRAYATIVLFELLTIYKKGIRKLSHSEQGIVHDYLLPRWLLLLAPLVPHMAEELWNKMGQKEFISVARWPEAEISKINPIAEYQEEFIEKVEEDIKIICHLAHIEKPNEISLYIADSWKYDFFMILQNMIKETRDQKALFTAVMKTDLKRKGEEIAKLIPSLLKDPTKMPSLLLSQELEFRTLEEERENLEKAVHCPVKVYCADKTTEAKARGALPGKPALLVK